MINFDKWARNLADELRENNEAERLELDESAQNNGGIVKVYVNTDSNPGGDGTLFTEGLEISFSGFQDYIAKEQAVLAVFPEYKLTAVSSLGFHYSKAKKGIFDEITQVKT